MLGQKGVVVTEAHAALVFVTLMKPVVNVLILHAIYRKTLIVLAEDIVVKHLAILAQGSDVTCSLFIMMQ